MSSPPRFDAPTVDVVPMRRRHLRAVLRIERTAQRRGWSLGLFLAELSRPEGRSYRVAVVDGAVVGFVGLLVVGDEAHVTTVAVDPAHRRRGVATALLVDVLGAARDAGAGSVLLEVRASNESALALYRTFGLAPVGVRQDYYEDPVEDALVLVTAELATPGYGERLERLAATAAAAGAPTTTGEEP